MIFFISKYSQRRVTTVLDHSLDREQLQDLLGEPVLARYERITFEKELEHTAHGYAVAQVVPEHLKEVRETGNGQDMRKEYKEK